MERERGGEPSEAWSGSLSRMGQKEEEEEKQKEVKGRPAPTGKREPCGGCGKSRKKGPQITTRENPSIPTNTPGSREVGLIEFKRLWLVMDDGAWRRLAPSFERGKGAKEEVSSRPSSIMVPAPA